MIKLINLLNLSDIFLTNFKIHCATSTKTSPLEVFFDGKFKEWQGSQNQRNFECNEILSLIHIDLDKWLFAGIYTVHGCKTRKNKSKTKYYYSTEEVTGIDHLVGRVIIQFNKNFRASYLVGKNHIDKLIVSEIRSQKMSVDDFIAYNSVLISYGLLCTIIREAIPTWKSALSIVAGVYLIVDTKTGKQYVGSAYGKDGIWNRWSRYAKDGHGGNKELKALLKKKGEKYTSNFQYSVLEVCDINSSDDAVIDRENHWKKALLSREFGLNIN